MNKYFKNSQSIKNGNLTPDELKTFIELSKNPEIAKSFIDLGVDEYDFVLHKGDLTIDGDLDLLKEKVCVLLIEGNLRVNGLFHDYDDPATFTLITGSLSANNIITSGQIEVQGDLHVSENLIGDYNDYSATISGNVKAGFFYPENHHFTIAGNIDFKKAYGSKYQVNEGKNKIKFIEPKELIKIIKREILEDIFEEEDDVDFAIDSRELIKKIKAGESLFKQ